MRNWISRSSLILLGPSKTSRRRSWLPSKVENLARLDQGARWEWAKAEIAKCSNNRCSWAMSTQPASKANTVDSSRAQVPWVRHSPSDRAFWKNRKPRVAKISRAKTHRQRWWVHINLPISFQLSNFQASSSKSHKEGIKKCLSRNPSWIRPWSSWWEIASRKFWIWRPTLKFKGENWPTEEISRLCRLSIFLRERPSIV